MMHRHMGYWFWVFHSVVLLLLELTLVLLGLHLLHLTLLHDDLLHVHGLLACCMWLLVLRLLSVLPLLLVLLRRRLMPRRVA